MTCQCLIKHCITYNFVECCRWPAGHARPSGLCLQPHPCRFLSTAAFGRTMDKYRLAYFSLTAPWDGKCIDTSTLLLAGYIFTPELWLISCYPEAQCPIQCPESQHTAELQRNVVKFNSVFLLVPNLHSENKGKLFKITICILRFFPEEKIKFHWLMKGPWIYNLNNPHHKDCKWCRVVQCLSHDVSAYSKAQTTAATLIWPCKLKTCLLGLFKKW